ncbi:hypothetical protein BDP27DRAFT_1382475 [Rhodocollybia butyracea]|uniref:Uncharacterized protein n=1 Tax=Rhodocollybia butyracea TaxID=206335 RepID=A0A9P5PZZ8_9AGAR|nr:hypothetical protein BDP27DRAFT_1382475 [Rhodocollybia butyracea]
MLHFITGKPYHDDGDLGVFVGTLWLLYYNQEVKNELTSGVDPWVEGMYYWIEQIRVALTSSEETECLRKTNFPVVLLTHFGSYITLAVGVFTDSANIEQLASIHLNIHPSNVRDLEAGARLVAALRSTTQLSALIFTRPRPEFPFRNSCCTFDGATHQFAYDKAFEDKRIFTAHLVQTPSTKRFIKFTRRYSEAAHAYAFDNGFAPKLLAVDRFYGWFMIVMEDISDQYITLWDLRKKDPRSALIDPTCDSVRSAITKLNDAGFVHVRDINVLVRKDNTSAAGVQIMFVDWDWAGFKGEAKYPHSLNPEVRRPAGAVPGALSASSMIWRWYLS